MPEDLLEPVEKAQKGAKSDAFDVAASEEKPRRTLQTRNNEQKQRENKNKPLREINLPDETLG